MRLLVGIDLSTTGLDIELDHALDVALCVEDLSGRVLFSHLWPVEIPIDWQLRGAGIVIAPESVEANHIRISSVLDDVARHIAEFVKQGGFVVGHNVLFDIGLLSLELKRYELPSIPQRVAPLVITLIDTIGRGFQKQSLEAVGATFATQTQLRFSAHDQPVCV